MSAYTSLLFFIYVFVLNFVGQLWLSEVYYSIFLIITSIILFCMAEYSTSVSHIRIWRPLANDSSLCPDRPHPHGAELRARGVGVRLIGDIGTVHVPLRSEHRAMHHRRGSIGHLPLVHHRVPIVH